MNELLDCLILVHGLFHPFTLAPCATLATISVANFSVWPVACFHPVHFSEPWQAQPAKPTCKASLPLATRMAFPRAHTTQSLCNRD